MLDSRWRKNYDRWVIDPLLKNEWIAKRSPNAITLLSTLSGLSIFFLLWQGKTTGALTALLLTGFFDTLDGAIARHRSIHSEQGAVLDILSDRLVEFSIILGLFAIAPHERAWTCMIMMGAVLLCITSFLVVGIFTQNSSHKSFHYSPGLMERTEAFLFFGGMILFPSLFSWMGYLFSALVLWTAMDRWYKFQS